MARSDKSNELNIAIGPNDRIVAIGASILLLHFAHALLDAGIRAERLLVIADAARIDLADQENLKSRGVAVQAIDADDVSHIDQVARESANTLSCVFAWHHIFPRSTIALFGGRLLNLHTGDLPRYRGAGGGSWQVLNGATHTAAHLHRLSTKVDQGELIFSKSVVVSADDAGPSDYKQAGLRAAQDVIGELVDAIKLGKTLIGREQNELEAVYFPRLKTEENAVIDFAWSKQDLVRFVRAFGPPFMGARFQYEDRYYRVLKASGLDVGIDFHPYCYGLIVNVSPYGVHVACRGGVVLFETIVCESSGESTRRFRIGGRFWNSSKAILQAQRFRPTISKL